MRMRFTNLDDALTDHYNRYIKEVSLLEDSMDKNLINDLFGIESLDIAWYGVLICLGIVAGTVTAFLLAKKRGYKTDVVIDYLLLALPLAVIGARLYYVFSEWSYYAENPISIIQIWNGGLAIYGAVIGALIAALIFCKWKKVPIGDILDFGGIGLIIGQAVGRWGNFVNQEAFGVAVLNPDLQFFPFAVNITDAHTVAEYDAALGQMVQVACEEPWHLATFFYESMWNLLVYAFLIIFAFKFCKRRGNVFAWYTLLYGFGRSIIEGMRTDSLWLIPGTVRISQALAIVLVIVSAIYLILTRKKGLNPAYEGPYSLNYSAEEAAEESAEEGKPAAEDTKETADAEEEIGADAE